MLRLVQTAAAVISAATLMGCTTLNVSSHVQRGLDFSQYQTYDWGPADALPTGDPRLDQNPFFKDHVMGAIEKQLANKGLERSTAQPPDLLIHYHASINQRIDVNRADRTYGYCVADDCPVDVIEYEAGTLVVDLVDTKTNRVIWRGWAQGTVEGVLDDEDRMERQINEAVTRMMAQFPL